MGSGTTGVACANTGRRFIGMERDSGYFEIAKQRILASMPKPANDNHPALLATVA
jgi:site-specific DNA-methyltransferase (adenine-specific)